MSNTDQILRIPKKYFYLLSIIPDDVAGRIFKKLMGCDVTLESSDIPLYQTIIIDVDNIQKQVDVGRSFGKDGGRPTKKRGGYENQKGGVIETERGGIGKTKPNIIEDKIIEDKIKEKIPPKSPRGGSESDEEFDKFYKAYPRRVNRMGALASRKKLTDDERQKAQQHIAHAFDGCLDIKYVPHPTTYLNQKRRESEEAFVSKSPDERRIEDKPYSVWLEEYEESLDENKDYGSAFKNSYGKVGSLVKLVWQVVNKIKMLKENNADFPRHILPQEITNERFAWMFAHTPEQVMAMKSFLPPASQ